MNSKEILKAIGWESYPAGELDLAPNWGVVWPQILLNRVKKIKLTVSEMKAFLVWISSSQKITDEKWEKYQETGEMYINGISVKKI